MGKVLYSVNNVPVLTLEQIHENGYIVKNSLYNPYNARIVRMKQRKIGEYEIFRDEEILNPLTLFLYRFWIIEKKNKESENSEDWLSEWCIPENQPYGKIVLDEDSPEEIIKNLIDNPITRDFAESFYYIHELVKNNTSSDSREIQLTQRFGNIDLYYRRNNVNRISTDLIKEPETFPKFKNREIIIEVNPDEKLEKIAGKYHFIFRKSLNVPNRIRIYGARDNVVGSENIGIFPFVWYPKGILNFGIRLYIPKNADKFIDYNNGRIINIGLPLYFRRRMTEYTENHKAMAKFLMLFLLDKKNGDKYLMEVKQ